MLINSKYFNMGPTTKHHSVIMEETICSTAITSSHVSNDVHSIMHMMEQMFSPPTETGLHACMCISVNSAFVVCLGKKRQLLCKFLFEINSVHVW